MTLSAGWLNGGRVEVKLRISRVGEEGAKGDNADGGAPGFATVVAGRCSCMRALETCLIT